MFLEDKVFHTGQDFENYTIADGFKKPLDFMGNLWNYFIKGVLECIKSNNSEPCSLWADGENSSILGLRKAPALVALALAII